jgi:hypothetical protein
MAQHDGAKLLVGHIIAPRAHKLALVDQLVASPLHLKNKARVVEKKSAAVADSESLRVP